jgi:RHS repeat-associated protein
MRAGRLTGTDTRYLLRDHLGSITGFMNGTAIDQEQAFDAWGRRENVGWASYMTVGGSTWNAIMGLTERGFTGHQHVDRLDLIHMNGRTYDPKLGRFMQADIVVQAPFDTQSYNRYSYLTNNPLNGTDPRGYFGVKDLVGVAVIAIGTYACAGNTACGTGTWALIGGAAGGAQSAAYGGDFQQIVTGAAWGAFSSAAFAGLNGVEAFGWGTAGQYGQHALNVAANGLLGGGIAVAQGGNFGHGFVSAGVSAAVMPSIGANFQGVERVMLAAVVGGTISEISGGKFANGAMSAAFQAAAAELAFATDTVAARDGSQIRRGSPEAKRELEAKIDALFTDGTLSELATYGTPADAAKAVLTAVVPHATHFGFEIGGNIELLWDGSESSAFLYSYTKPNVGLPGRVRVSGHAIGYHSHPPQDFGFSNRYTNPRGPSDIEWMMGNRRMIFVGAQFTSSPTSPVGVLGCSPSNCANIDAPTGATGWWVQ